MTRQEQPSAYRRRMHAALRRSGPAPVSHLLPASILFTSLVFRISGRAQSAVARVGGSHRERRRQSNKIRTQTDADEAPWMKFTCTVRASASQGGVIALDDTLCFDIACSNHLMVSPPLRGSNPYPCGSLTYRILHSYFRTCPGVCQPPVKN